MSVKTVGGPGYGMNRACTAGANTVGSESQLIVNHNTQTV